MARTIFVVMMGILAVGCAQTAVTVSETGSVEAVLKRKGYEVQTTTHVTAVAAMTGACEARGLALAQLQLPMTQDEALKIIGTPKALENFSLPIQGTIRDIASGVQSVAASLEQLAGILPWHTVTVNGQCIPSGS